MPCGLGERKTSQTTHDWSLTHWKAKAQGSWKASVAKGSDADQERGKEAKLGPGERENLPDQDSG